jgi:hypothetical protein
MKNETKIVNRIHCSCNASKGKTIEAAWPKVSDLIGKNFCELLKNKDLVPELFSLQKTWFIAMTR